MAIQHVAREFEWELDPLGYEILESDVYMPREDVEEHMAQDEPLSEEHFQPKDRRRFIVQKSTRNRYYRFFDSVNAAAFRSFSSIGNPEGAVAFANKYGFLGGGTHVISLDPTDRYHVTLGEDLDGWLEAATEMDGAVQMWEGSRSHGTGTRRLLTIQAYDGLGLSRWVKRSRRKDFVKAVEGEQPLPVGEWLMWWVSAHLDGVKAVLTLSSDRSGFAMSHVPDTLHSALWLQLALAMEGEKEYRRCLGCGEWFEYSKDASRPDKVYCSNACRARAYRRRQVEAHALCQRGLTPERIAEQLNTTPDAVRRWIEKEELRRDGQTPRSQ
jgi:hypothetical protein